MTIKQVIVIRKDLNMRRGKAEAQAAHASTMVFIERSTILPNHSINTKILHIPITEEIEKWILGNYKKISLSCNSEEELNELYTKANNLNLPCSYIIDSGLTEFNGIPTPTCIAIGPAKSEDIDKITGHLKLR